ncbi:M23 family metallopeptidase [Sphingomonas sp. PP-CE-1G-424]|uniref:M23 family metallopeptidase n=1 Tax=Sphingomonas sp. PP-CE-1G-424 TaxID=2135658 RepID=UPI001056866A|nr:M23 family metallopeptidase [Sphingomonas sp. PP-CE-1G-424]TCP67995.1 peptidase M23-like protein [Sphingomonas sp. PP-CE-1G-424]
MTRTFWIILGLIVVAIGAFASMVSFGSDGSGIERRIPWRKPAPPTEVATVSVTPGALAVPVAGIPRKAIADSWNDARGGGLRGHHGTDIMAPSGTPVLAAAPGRVEKLFQSGLGGITLYVRSPDRRWTYYYAHLAGYAAGIREGMAVKAGDTLGYVGDTGDAGAGNYHLHFGLTKMQPGERWWQGENVNPYPLLAGRERAR